MLAKLRYLTFFSSVELWRDVFRGLQFFWQKIFPAYAALASRTEVSFDTIHLHQWIPIFHIWFLYNAMLSKMIWCCSLKTMRRLLLALVSLMIAIVIFSTVRRLTDENPLLDVLTIRIHSPQKFPVFDFKGNWCRLQRWRVDWESLLASCRLKLGWKDRKVRSKLRTHALNSYVARWDLKPAGG